MYLNQWPNTILGTRKESKVNRTWALAIIAILATAAISLTGCGDDEASQVPPTDLTPPGAVTPPVSLMPLDTIGLDPEPSDNTPLSVGTIETCKEVTANDAFDADVVVDGIPEDRPMQGFQVDLVYDSALFTVLGVDANVMLGADPGSRVLEELTEDTPSDDGRFTIAAADFGSDRGETGSGVLARLTLQVKPAAPAGTTTPLRLEEIEIVDDNVLTIEADEVKVTQIAIGTACP